MNIANLLLRITGDNDDAKRSLHEIAAELKSFASEDAEARIKLAGVDNAKRELDGLERSLTLVGQRDVTARVKVKIDKERDVIGGLRRELEHSLAGGVGARAIGDIIGDIGRAGTRVAALGEEAGGVFARLSGGAASLASNLGSTLVGAIGQVVLQLGLLIGAAVLLIPIISAVLGVIAALAAGLIAAAAGLAALAIAFGGVLIPALAVGIALVVRLAGAFKALSDQQKKAKQNAQELKDAQEQHSAAVRNAEQANQRVIEAETEARKAQRDSVLEVQSAELALAESRLGITDAQIRLERAKENLKELKGEAREAGPAFERLFNQFQNVAQMSPSDLAAATRRIGSLPGKSDSQLDIKEALQEVAHAQLGVKEAKLGEEQATNRLSDAQEKQNAFVRQGIRAYGPYVQALQASAEANRQVAKSAERIGEIRQKQAGDTAKYSRQELSTARELMKLWTQLKSVFERAAKPALEGVHKLISSISDLIADPKIQAALISIGEAFGYVFEQFADLLRTKEVRDTFTELAKAAARMVRVVGGDILRDFFLILLRIARYAAPELISLFRRFARFLDRLTDGEGAADRLHGGVRRVLRTFNIWLGIARAVARVIINFVKAAIGQSDHLSRNIRRVVNRFADFLDTDEGRKKVSDWLDHSITLVGRIVTGFANLIDTLNKVLGPLGKVYNFISGAAEKAGKLAFGGESVASKTQDLAGIARFRSLIASAPTQAEKDRLRATARATYPGVKFAQGGIVSQLTNAIIGDVPGQREAVVPLTAAVLSGIGAGIVEATGRAAGGRPISALPGGSPGRGDNRPIHIMLPPPVQGGTFDARDASVKLGRELEARGIGSLVG
jgi:hypothetical protein